MQRISGYVQQGNVTVTTGGIASTTVVEGSYPGATVTVYNQGTLVLASIFADNIGTVKANPFTSSSTDGSFFFYAASGRYDIQFSGTGITTPFTIGDVLLYDPAASGALTVAGNITMTQPTAATAGANQSSFSLCEQGSYWTGAAAAVDQWCWQDVLGTGANPTSTLTLTHSGSSGTASISLPAPLLSANITGALTAQSVNSVLTVGGTSGYATMAACLAALPGTGGICAVIPNYTETLAANIVLTKNQHLYFMGPAIITMGTFSITAAHGVDGISITSVRGHGSSANSAGVVFNYAGTGCAFSFGDSTGTTYDGFLAGFTIATGGTASATARGLCLNSTQRWQLDRLVVNGGLNASQIGILVDGTFSFAGDITWNNIVVGGFPTGITLQNNADANFMYNIVVSNVGAGGIGISLPSFANGNIIQADIESISGANGAVNLGNAVSVFGNRISIYGQGNTWDFVCGASANGNWLDNVGAQSASQIATTGCAGGNTIVNPYKWGFDQSGTFLMNGNATITSAPPSALPSSAAGWKYCIFGNTFCTGIESSTEVHQLGNSGAGQWFSIFGGTVANNATATTPDTAATVSLGTDGTFRNASGSRVGQAYVSGCNGTATASTTIDLSWPGSATPACTNTATTLRVPTPTAGTLGNLRVRCGTGGALAASGVFTVLKNNAPSTITCTTGVGTTCADTTHTVAVAAGDDLLVQFTTQVGETLANCAATFEKW